MYINYIIKLRHYVRKGSKKIGGKGYILLLVAKLIGAVPYIGRVTVLSTSSVIFCHVLPYSTKVLLYFTNRAIYSNIRQCKGNMRGIIG